MAKLDYFGAEQFRTEEDKQRDKLICAGCGKPKDTGLIVCWECFKRGPNPYKYFQGTFEQWLAMIYADQHS